MNRPMLSREMLKNSMLIPFPAFLCGFLCTEEVMKD